MKGLKIILESRSIDETYFTLQNDVFRYDMWYEGAEYSIFIQHFNKELIEVSLLHFQKDMWLNRHLYMSFNEFVDVFDKTEFEVFIDRKIPFAKKPIEVWKRLENAFGGYRR